MENPDPRESRALPAQEESKVNKALKGNGVLRESKAQRVTRVTKVNKDLRLP